MAIYRDPSIRPSLEPHRYHIQDHERQFFLLLTGIKDDQQLRGHILAVQQKAYQVHTILFQFTSAHPLQDPQLRLHPSFFFHQIAQIPGYYNALKLLDKRTDPILLDLGCCFGNDIRKAVVDGWPVQNVIASDLRQEFWDAGHELFKSTPESFPAAFIAGDIFDPSMLDIDIDIAPTPTDNDIRPLTSLTTLTPLKHRVSAIHASSFFHLFNEDQQRLLALRLAALLLPERGSIIFGQHGARPEKGFRIEVAANSSADAEPNPTKHAMFCHSPASWKHLWEQDIFGPHQPTRVRVDAELQETTNERWDFEDLGTNLKVYVMNWSVEVI
ncbi:Methyltransferase adrK [Psilocybe cubensis]|uniref:Methyltransferase adrK n=1 Tax=Psilocybe cubensis TaxID=181762 RepID=A0ACB8H170_PSICU|nr:Methyltransferase adrK [Psilocybe cubensis]KAH9481576.1 Methyltransferase adrK [Psilocybe cubensis]